MKKLLLAGIVAVGLTAVPAIAAERADTIRSTQQMLKDKGYYQGEVDGVLGPQTRRALRLYQKEHNLTANGRMTRETAERLGAVKADDASVGSHFEEAGDAIADKYSAAGSRVAKGTKEAGSELKEGEVTQGAVEFGKGVGTASKKVAVGTKDAAVSAAKGVKDAFDGDDDAKQERSRKK
jgi:peptidoglycan hydrolase-like protein with peptidoglycan-binding domain